MIDTDNSGGLGHDEIFNAIQASVAGSDLTEQEMNTLAGFVIHQVRVAFPESHRLFQASL